MCDSIANKSASSLVIPYCSAIRFPVSAITIPFRGSINPSCIMLSIGVSILTFPSSALATVNGDWDIDSIPPAIIISDSPALIAFAASMIAFILDPHILLIVSAGISAGIPAFRAACLAGCCPIPADNTFPMITSSINSALIPVFSKVEEIAIAPRSTAGTLNKDPLNFP